MTLIHTEAKLDFPGTLTALRRSPEIPEAADVYGWLIGSWELEVRHYRVDVTGQGLRGEVHLSWVLEGRAVQDVWIMPRVADRSPGLAKTNNMYGTTLRIWDESIQAWRITWNNPVTGQRDEQVGRWSGRDIVQVGTHADGTPTRWRFTEITRDSFHWIGEVMQPDGETWKLEAEFLARRTR